MITEETIAIGMALRNAIQGILTLNKIENFVAGAINDADNTDVTINSSMSIILGQPVRDVSGKLIDVDLRSYHPNGVARRAVVVRANTDPASPYEGHVVLYNHGADSSPIYGYTKEALNEFAAVCVTFLTEDKIMDMLVGNTPLQ